jgi:hypothetical protein
MTPSPGHAASDASVPAPGALTMAHQFPATAAFLCLAPYQGTPVSCNNIIFKAIFNTSKGIFFFLIFHHKL